MLTKLEFTRIMADLKDDSGSNPLYDYFVQTEWKSSHLKVKWNKLGYDACAGLLKKDMGHQDPATEEIGMDETENTEVREVCIVLEQFDYQVLC